MKAIHYLRYYLKFLIHIFLDFMDREKFLALSYKNNFFKDKSVKLPYRIQESSFKKNKKVSKDIYNKLIKFSFIDENSFIIKDNSYYCFFFINKKFSI